MTACLALAFAVNRRPTRRRRRPGLTRAGWIAAAASMFAAMPGDAPRAGAAALVVSGGELAVLAILVVLVLAAIVAVARGVNADRDDRLLIGALGGIVAFVALAAASVPPPAIGWIYPFSVLIGAALARANGNIRRP
jgi:hypothetical protein